MDEYRENVKKVQKALNQDAAFIQSNPYLAQRVLNAANAKSYGNGGIVVKKKFSMGFILIMVLLLSSVTALAIGLVNYFGGYAALEHSYGEYSEWPDNAKVQLVRLMAESGLPLNWNLVDEMEASTTDAEAAGIAEKIIEEYFGGDMKMDTYNVMLHELGSFDRWSIEDKAYYSSMLVKYGKYKNDWTMYLMPEDGAATAEEIIQVASEILVEKFDASLDYGKVSVSYAQNKAMYGEEPVWLFSIGSAQNEDAVYSVVLNSSGTVLTYNAPNEHPYSIDTDVIGESQIATPGEWDISEEEAIRLGLQALADIGDYDKYMQEIHVNACFIYNNRFCGGNEPVWLLNFIMNDEVVYKMVLGYDGTYFASVPADQEFEGVWRESGIGADLIDLDFRNMNVEEKAAFSERWNPIVNEYMSTHPYYKNYNGLMYQATRQVYGIPGDGDMTQEEATQIAEDEILRLGASSTTLKNRRILYSYDITDPMNPLWKLLIYHVAFDKMPNDPIDTDYISYQVVIDGNTGTILRSINNTQEGFDGFNK